jgi:putative FmdB family regulatory protein
MPIYDFRCVDCLKTFESLMKPWEPVQCPHCRSQAVDRLPSTFGGYQIKGDNSASQRPKGAGHRGGK